MLALPRAVLAQVPDSLRPRLPAHLPATGPALQGPAAPRGPWNGGVRALIAFDSSLSTALDSARMVRAATVRALSIYGRRADTTRAPTARRNILGLDQKYADLAIDGQAGLDIRT